MNKFRITYPNNKEVREYLSTLSLCKAKKSRTTKNVDGSINYGDYTFDSYDNLKATFIKESYHSYKCLNNIPYSYAEDMRDFGIAHFLEESEGFYYLYQNSGLVMNSSITSFSQANSYALQVGYPLYKKNILNFLYNTPRRW